MIIITSYFILYNKWLHHHIFSPQGQKGGKKKEKRGTGKGKEGGGVGKGNIKTGATQIPVNIGQSGTANKHVPTPQMDRRG